MNVPYGFGSLDRTAFHLINAAWTHPVLDRVMPAITDANQNKWVVFGAAPAAIAFWLYKGRRRALKVLIIAALACGACDLLAFRVIKPAVHRLRPNYAGIGAIVRASEGGKFGFPSNHATNASAAASVLTVAYPAFGIVFWSVAGLIAYSRVYCGVHYPFDVLAGLALGLLAWPWAALMLGSGDGVKKKKR